MANSTITTPMANTTTETPFEEAENFHLFIGVTIFSTVFLFAIIAPTLGLNGMTLFAIYRDPLKCFRNPLAMFVTGVLVADFISGLIVYPLFGAVYAHELRVGENVHTYKVFHVAGRVLTATVTISFLTLLGLAISQLIAVNSPMRYDRCVTVRGVKIGLICVWVYAALFTIVPHFFRTDHFFLFFLIFHVTVVTVTLVILYIVTYLFFASRAARQLDEEENKQVSKEFFKGTCILALLQIILVWPLAITLYIDSFLEIDDVETAVRIEAALMISDNLLFTKFLLDPIILVWRVPKYNQAMKIVFPRFLGSGQDSGPKSRVSYSRGNARASKDDHDDNSMDDVDVEVI